MKKLFLAGAMLASFAAIQSATAADLALKAPPPPAPVFSWTGWYVGVNLGGSFGKAADTATFGAPPTVFSSTSSRLDGVIGGGWTGWYVGGNLGYSWGKDNGPVTFSDPFTGPLLSVNSNTRLDGVIGGLQIGHNWQIQNWVYGLKADIQASGRRGSSTIVCPGGTAAALNGTCSPGHLWRHGAF